MSMVPMTPNAMYIEMALDRLKRQEPGTQHEAGKPTRCFKSHCFKSTSSRAAKKNCTSLASPSSAWPGSSRPPVVFWKATFSACTSPKRCRMEALFYSGLRTGATYGPTHA